MVQLCRSLAILGVALSLGTASAQGVNRSGAHTVNGVVAVHHRNGNGGTVTITSQRRGRNNGQNGLTNQGATRSFSVDGRTRITGGALHQGAHVTVRANGRHATHITVHQRSARQNRRFSAVGRRGGSQSQFRGRTSRPSGNSVQTRIAAAPRPAHHTTAPRHVASASHHAHGAQHAHAAHHRR
jgi:hypothetical protein